MTSLRRLALAYLSEGTRVLDLISNRETHVVKAFEHKGRDGRTRIAVRLWFDPTIHKVDGTGTVRSIDQFLVM